MNADGETSVADTSIDGLALEDLATDFRVVATGSKRRGIRLERIFWSSLRSLAGRERRTIGAVVDELALKWSAESNLASVIRVAAHRAALNQVAKYARVASMQTVNGIVAASPSPAFVLSEDRRLIAANPAFQAFVRRQLPAGQTDTSKTDIRLTLDQSVKDILEKLTVSDGTPIACGIVFGAGERRYRSQVNVIRAPLTDTDLIIAFLPPQ